MTAARSSALRTALLLRKGALATTKLTLVNVNLWRRR